MRLDVPINNTSGAASVSGGETRHDTCLHCGQKLLSSAHRRSGFCCTGCNAAYQFITELGLDYFYCLRELDGESISSVASTSIDGSFEFYNDPNFRDQFLSLDEETGVCSMELQLFGLHCAACLWVIEKLKDVIPGIIEMRVNIVTAKAKVRFYDAVISPSAIAASIAKLGYKPHPLSPFSKNDRSNSAEDRELAMRLGVAAFSAMNIMLLFVARYQGLFTGIESEYSRYFAWFSLIISLPAVFYSAVPFYKTSVSSLRFRRLHIDLPITIAIIGGFIASAVNTILGRPEIYFDTVTALIFLLLCGRWCQRRALTYASDISSLLYTFTSLSAKARRGASEFKDTFTLSIEVGDEVLLQSGERVPCDGHIISGSGIINNSVLTGESRPIEVSQGDYIFAGALNEGTDLIFAVDKPLKASRMGKLLSDIESTPLHQSKIARFVDAVSVYFVVTVIVISLATFLYHIDSGFWAAWDRVIAFIVVTCPCALGIATPVTLSLTNAYAAKRGILFRSASVLERLTTISEVVFDKTGTLTEGKLSVRDVSLFSQLPGDKTVWDVVGSLEHASKHPVGRALYDSAKDNSFQNVSFDTLLEFDGRGVVGKRIQGSGNATHSFALGSIRFMRECGVVFSEIAHDFIDQRDALAETLVGLSYDTTLIAVFSLGDTLRHEAPEAIASLKRSNVAVKIMSGDSGNAVHQVAASLGIADRDVFSERSPEEKETYIRLRAGTCAFVGDGVNDAPAIKRASVGIAMSGGAEISMRSADVFLATPDLRLLPEMFDGARKTVRLIHTHLLISLLYNVSAGTLALLGIIGPLGAAFIMPASSLTVILSSVCCVPFRRRCQ